MKKLRTPLAAVTAAAILALAPSAFAQCPDLIEIDCDGGWAWFGLRYDGANLAQGQSVTLPCDAAILGCEFEFLINGTSNGGVPSLEAGDEILAAVLDADDNILMTAVTEVPSDMHADWLAFDFVEDMIVPMGVYRIIAYTLEPRQCSIVFCPGQDAYPDGERQVSINGIDGPFATFGDGHDIPFRLHVNSELVATDPASLTSVKALFR